MNNSTSVMLFFGVLGIIFIIVGIGFHLGKYRRVLVYWTTWSSAVYAMIPLGICLLCFSLMTKYPYPDSRGIVIMYIAGLFLLTGFVFGLTMPMFITPWWFRYLRENYNEDFILRILMKDAGKNYSEWMERTKDLEGLAEWAEEVASKTTIEDV